MQELREKLEDLNDQIRDVKSITKELEEEKKDASQTPDTGVDEALLEIVFFLCGHFCPTARFFSMVDLPKSSKVCWLIFLNKPLFCRKLIFEIHLGWLCTVRSKPFCHWSDCSRGG